MRLNDNNAFVRFPHTATTFRAARALIIIGRESRHSPTIPDRYDKSLRLGQGRVVSKAATAEKESVDGITVFFQNVGPGIAYDVDFEVIKDSEAGDFLVDNQKPSSWHSQKNPMRTLARGQKYPSRL
jgi:hypothetical protein